MNTSRLGALMVAVGLLLSAPAASAQPEPSRTEMLTTYVRLLSAATEVLDAQSGFNVARAAGDRSAMEQATVDLLDSAGRAAFWSVVLDEQVTEANTSAEIERTVGELRALATGTFQRMVPLIVAADFDALGARLDGSADNLNRLFALTHAISTMTGMPRLPAN